MSDVKPKRSRSPHVIRYDPYLGYWEVWRESRIVYGAVTKEECLDRYPGALAIALLKNTADPDAS